jgi:hypothetical protein
MSRKVTLVKKNLAPSAKPLGVNPMDPWSTKANISESSEKELLHRFLKAKGINPMFVSTDTKIAHSKSGEFIKWRRDHDFQEQIEPEILKQMIDEGVFTDDESIAKHLVKKYGKNVDAHQIRLAHHFHPEKHKTTPERIAGHVNRLLGKPVTEESIDEGLYVDHEEIAKHLVNRKGANVNANDIHHASILHKDAHKVSTDLVRRHVLHLLGKGPNPQYEGTSALDRFRQAAAEREKKHNEIEKQMKARHAAGKEDMKGSIDRLEKHLNKEEVEQIDELTDDQISKLRSDAGAHMKKSMDNASSARIAAHKNPPAKKGFMARVGQKQINMVKGAYHGLTKEEVEKLKESPKEGGKRKFSGMYNPAPKGTFAYDQAQKKSGHKVGDSVTVNSKFFGKQKGKVTKVDNQSVHVVRDGKSSAEKYPHDAVVKESAGINKTKETQFHKKLDTLVHNTFGKRKDELKMKEDVYQDAQAATQTAFDMGTTPNQTEPTSSRRREMSKSARIIKSLYKKHKMVKEEMYDHEKEDKSVQTYGKKPKMAATDKKDSFGENKPDAAAIMSGGTTLTGGKRDDVEIDPMMRNKPGQNVFNKEFGKKGS